MGEKTNEDDFLLPIGKDVIERPEKSNKKKIVISVSTIILLLVSIPFIYKYVHRPPVELPYHMEEIVYYENKNAKPRNDTKISIIMPVYNTEKFVGRAIQSALNQTLEELEVICINDASTDNSLDVVLKYVEKDPRVKCLNLKKNGGQSVARNRGLKLARGEFIGFIDSDDEVMTEFYDNLYKQSKDYDIVVGRLAGGTNLNGGYKPYSKVDYLHGYCGDSIWRRSFINQYNLEFPLGYRIAEDYHFRVNFYNLNPRILNTTEDIFYIYRLREGSLCHYSEDRINSDTNDVIKFNNETISEENKNETKSEENKNETKSEENKNETKTEEDKN